MQNYNIIATHHIILKGFSIAVDEFGVYNAFANLDPHLPTHNAHDNTPCCQRLVNKIEYFRRPKFQLTSTRLETFSILYCNWMLHNFLTYTLFHTVIGERHPFLLYDLGNPCKTMGDWAEQNENFNLKKILPHDSWIF